MLKEIAFAFKFIIKLNHNCILQQVLKLFELCVDLVNNAIILLSKPILILTKLCNTMYFSTLFN